MSCHVPTPYLHNNELATIRISREDSVGCSALDLLTLGMTHNLSQFL